MLANVTKINDHKKKYPSSKKPHLSGGVIYLWYLEWQKQEKHIELFLFTSKLIRFQILHSNWVRWNFFISCFIMILFRWKGNCYCSFTDVFIAIANNIHNKVSFNLEYFKNFLSFSSILFTISGALLKEEGY